MATFQDIQNSVSKRLLDPNNVSIALADVANSINDAISYWKFRRFWFNEITDQVTMTYQDPIIPLTGDILVPMFDDDGFNIEYSSMRYPLRKISQQVFDHLYLTNGYGLPAFYSRTSQTFQVYPIPDRAYTLNRHYLKEYAALSGNTDTNDFTIYASRLITLWTLANMSAEFRQDSTMEAYYRQAANDEYKNLRVMADKTNGTGKLTIYSDLCS